MVVCSANVDIVQGIQRDSHGSGFSGLSLMPYCDVLWSLGSSLGAVSLGT